MGWLIDPTDRAVFVCTSDRIQMIDKTSTILPVPSFAAEIELTVEKLFSWIKKAPNSSSPAE